MPENDPFTAPQASNPLHRSRAEFPDGRRPSRNQNPARFVQIGGCARLAPNKGQLRSVRSSVSSTRERGLLLPRRKPGRSRDIAAGSGLAA